MAKKTEKIETAEVMEVETTEVAPTETESLLLDKIRMLEEELAKANQANEELKNTKKVPGGERKAQVLALLKHNGPISIKGMATVMNTTTRNISSVLTAIRNSGYVIHTDNVGQKYIVSEPEVTITEEN